MAVGDSVNERKIGWLAKEWGGVELELKVLKSAAGFYLGTRDEEGPYSRESEEYWRTFEEAEATLTGAGQTSWTQRLAP